MLLRPVVGDISPGLARYLEHTISLGADRQTVSRQPNLGHPRTYENMALCEIFNHPCHGERVVRLTAVVRGSRSLPESQGKSIDVSFYRVMPPLDR